MKYDIIWRVEEVVNGPGHHDKGIRDGDHRTLAEGKVQKEGDSEAVLRAELTEVLEKSFPRHALGPTYDLDRIYHIDITDALVSIDVKEDS